MGDNTTAGSDEVPLWALLHLLNLSGLTPIFFFFFFHTSEYHTKNQLPATKKTSKQGDRDAAIHAHKHRLGKWQKGFKWNNYYLSMEILSERRNPVLPDPSHWLLINWVTFLISLSHGRVQHLGEYFVFSIIGCSVVLFLDIQTWINKSVKNMN